MRIIGYLPHEHYKLTVFKDNNRLSIKVESGLYEQTYKFRDRPELQTLDHAQSLVDDQWLSTVGAVFQTMHRAKNAALGRYLPPTDEYLDTII